MPALNFVSFGFCSASRMMMTILIVARLSPAAMIDAIERRHPEEAAFRI